MFSGLKKTILLIILNIWVLNLLSAQRSILQIPYFQSAQDIETFKNGFLISGTTWHNSEDRSDICISLCDNSVIIRPEVISIFDPLGSSIISSSIAPDPNLHPDLSIPQTFAVTGTRNLISTDAISNKPFISCYNNLDNTILWSRISESEVGPRSKCIYLTNGDIIFMHNDFRVEGVYRVALTRLNTTGSVIWEKSYTFKAESGFNNNVRGRDIIPLSDNYFAISGDFIDPSIPFGTTTGFVAIMDDNGTCKKAIATPKSTNETHSSITMLSQSTLPAGNIFYLGTEYDSGITKIIIGRMALNGNMLSHKIVKYLDAPIGYNIIPWTIAVEYNSDQAGVSLVLQNGSDRINLYLRYSAVTDEFVSASILSPSGLDLLAVSRYYDRPKLVTARTIPEVGIGRDICIEGIDMDGQDPPCFTGMTIIDLRHTELTNYSKIKLKGKDIDITIPFELSTHITSHSRDKCSPPSDLFLKSDASIPLAEGIQLFNDEINYDPFSGNIYGQDKNSTSDLKIFTLDGREVQSGFIFKGPNYIKLSNLPNGVYIIYNSRSQKYKKIFF